ncbi:MAG: fascin domain-containing protein [Bacteroidota bacterium]
MKTKIYYVLLSVFLIACGSQSKPTAKIILKSFNNQYVSLNADQMLVANQINANKAEVFEKIDLGNNKIALKAANGKFVCADQSKYSFLYANRSAKGEWETFEINILDSTKLYLKASNGQYVSTDQSQEGALVASSENAKDWEVFTIE